MKSRKMLLTAISIIILSQLLSWMLQSSLGKIQIQDFSYVDAAGYKISGRIYIPKGVTEQNSAPAVITCAGGNNTFSMMRNINTSLAKCGYVVITYNSYKHGNSAIAQTETMGAAEILTYAHTLRFVDQENIGVIGHTRGSAYLFKAILQDERIRTAMSLDTTELLNSLNGYSSDTPINCGWIMSNYNEFLYEPGNYGNKQELWNVFGVDTGIIENQIYGSKADNTIRLLYTVDTIDAAYPYSAQYMEYIKDFLAKTMKLPSVNTHNSNDISWPALEMLGIVSLVGITLLMRELAAFITKRVQKKNANYHTEEIVHCTRGYGLKMQLCSAVVVALPLLPLYMLGKKILMPNFLFPQNDVNGFALWAVFAGIFYFAVAVLFDKLKRRKLDYMNIMSLERLNDIGLYFIQAFIAMCLLYLLNYVSQNSFGLEFGVFNTRFFSLSLRKIIAVAIYYPVFLIYFLFSGVFQIRFLYIKTGKHCNQYVHGMLFHTLGFCLLYLTNYIGFLTIGHSLFHWARFGFGPILSIIPLMPIVGLISTWSYKHTGKIYFGAFLNTFLFVWLLVGTSAFYYS